MEWKKEKKYQPFKATSSSEYHINHDTRFFLFFFFLPYPHSVQLQRFDLRFSSFHHSFYSSFFFLPLQFILVQQSNLPHFFINSHFVCIYQVVKGINDIIMKRVSCITNLYPTLHILFPECDLLFVNRW